MSKENQVVLKPCPFCGNKVELKFGKVELFEDPAKNNFALLTEASIRCEGCKMARASHKVGVVINSDTMELVCPIKEHPDTKKLIRDWNRRDSNE